MDKEVEKNESPIRSYISNNVRNEKWIYRNKIVHIEAIYDGKGRTKDA